MRRFVITVMAVKVNAGVGRLLLLHVPKQAYYLPFSNQIIILGIFWIRAKNSE
jgi:hypothetical protein